MNRDSGGRSGRVAGSVRRGGSGRIISGSGEVVFRIEVAAQGVFGPERRRTPVAVELTLSRVLALVVPEVAPTPVTSSAPVTAVRHDPRVDQGVRLEVVGPRETNRTVRACERLDSGVSVHVALEIVRTGKPSWTDRTHVKFLA